MENMTITTIDQLKEYSYGQIVELPAFADEQPFIARLKRPSFLAMAKAGKLPNRLLQSANKLFSSGSLDDKNPEAMNDMFEILDIVCDACFLEPTYEDIKKAKIELTDDQLMFVFAYSQRGVKALESFREQPQNTELARGGTAV